MSEKVRMVIARWNRSDGTDPPPWVVSACEYGGMPVAEAQSAEMTSDAPIIDVGAPVAIHITKTPT